MLNGAAPDLATISTLPVVWHSTTPRRFECQPGCVCCCVNTMFFHGEAERLPFEMAAYLFERNGLVRPRQRPPGVCAFFDAHRPTHCTIPQYRPLRCRLYPYLPVISGDSIVIVADPLCTVTWSETDHPDWFRCYGLGRGPSVEVQVEEMSREFLRRIVAEHPDIAKAHLCVPDVDALINAKEVDKVRRPLYAEWDTETIRRASQLDYDATIGADGSRQADCRRRANGFG